MPYYFNFHNFRCEKEKNLKMLSVKIVSLWQTGLNIPSGKKTKMKFNDQGAPISGRVDLIKKI